jgi:aminoglycoside phosphotransferase (APT) family kinase protein
MSSAAAESSQPQLVPVLPNHRFDEAALGRYLAANLPGFDGRLTIRQFQGGQSNPTFHVQVGHVQAGGRAVVLRKKPPGALLPSAHAVDREYRVLKALAGSAVPVPAVHLLCTDEGVIGQMFYVMDWVDGRVFPDRLLPGCSPTERAAMYDHMNEVLAALHRVDWRAVGLEGFGRPDGYVARQIARWSRQYAASRTEPVAAMDRLIEWLPAHRPAGDAAAIAHGDYRVGNLIFHPTEPRVVAVLDWELATIGHPLADLAYNCLAYRLSGTHDHGFPMAEIGALGLPAEADYVAAYAQRTGRAAIDDWEFFIVFAMFRIAAILAGVYRRGLDGNAADARALEASRDYREIADRAWEIARSLG